MEGIGLDRLADNTVDDGASDADVRISTSSQPAAAAAAPSREWSSDHPINLRTSLPIPFLGRCYVTLVAGRERRRKERLAEDRLKHPLETSGNLTLLFSLGVVTTMFLLLTAALVLIHGFGWSIQLTIPT
jgi:hypothetical protein